MNTCHPTAHDFHHTNLCHECGQPREDRLPSQPMLRRQNDDGTFREERPRFAGAYGVALAYGGREEGGWWEELYIPLASALIRPDDDVMAVARALWDAFSEYDDGREVSDSIASRAVRILWEDTPSEHAVTSVGRYQ